MTRRRFDPENIPPYDFGRAVRLVRVDRGLTVFKMAQMAGMSQSMLSFVERGRRVPSPVTRQKIKLALRITDTRLANILDALE